jgi:single-stranded-DNA-specific exonuclease
MTIALGIEQSITGRSWRWRGTGNPSGDPEALVADLLRARGCPEHDIERQRRPTIRDLMPDPSLFRDMDAAAERIAHAVRTQERITIFGDYDVDGATSAALLVRLLRGLGLEPGIYIPDRLMEGYGPSAEALIRLGEQGSRLIVTVDCGAQAFAALEAAKGAGIDVIVVDHHQCATTLPPAHALVNPNRLDETPDAAEHGHLAAVGVAFLLGAAIMRQLRAHGWFADRPEPNLMALLDVVALGTVADVAQIRGLNRAFVAQGLKIMARGQNIGLDALLRVSGINRAPSVHDLGFALGPRINAGGRVGAADLGVRLLTTSDPAEADAIARQLDSLNAERRAIEAAVQAEAEEQIEAQGDAPIVVAAGVGWHPGVIGIVAGRLKEKTGRPAIVIALGEDGTGKGSGRSITGVDLGAAVLAAKDEGLLLAGGGHAMAAGLTVAGDGVSALGAYLSRRLAETVEKARAHSALLIDAVVAPGGVTPGLVEALDGAGPYGNGWPAPRIATGPARIIKADVVGTGHVRVVLAGNDSRSIKAVAFRQAEQPLGQALLGAGRDRRLWVTGRAKVDDWNGRTSAELHLDDAAWA